jgi:hypothetical protein
VAAQAAVIAGAAVPAQRRSDPDPNPVERADQIGLREPLKSKVFGFLDNEVRSGDPRVSRDFGALIAEKFECTPNTGKRYFNAWRAELEQGNRPNAVLGKLRLVPDKN